MGEPYLMCDCGCKPKPSPSAVGVEKQQGAAPAARGRLDDAIRAGCLTTQRSGGAIRPHCAYPKCKCAGIDGYKAAISEFTGEKI